MNNCGNKIKNTCSEKNYATCIYYELAIPEISSLTGDCITLEETTQDLYEIAGGIKSEIELSELGNNCLAYVQDSGKTLVKNVLLKYEEEICLLKDKVSNLEDQAICDKVVTNCLDLTGLVDQCNSPINTLGELLQYLVAQHQI